jgi:hypothetical protein
MFKRILSLVLIISFLSIGFCFAFDSSSIKSIWDDCVPKIIECWNIALAWINNDMKPWIERVFGAEVRQEFERELNEAFQEVPIALKALWEAVKGLL